MGRRRDRRDHRCAPRARGTRRHVRRPRSGPRRCDQRSGTAHRRSARPVRRRGAVVLGEIDGRVTPRIGELHRAFLDFDDAAIVTTNIWGYLWGKLAYGAQLFATALTSDSIADALADPSYRDIHIEIAREVMRVARARHITPEGFNGFD